MRIRQQQLQSFSTKSESGPHGWKRVSRPQSALEHSLRSQENAGVFSISREYRQRLGPCRTVALPIQPDILKAPTIEAAVDHDREAFHVGLSTGCAARVEDDRAHPTFVQLALDLPDQLPARTCIRDGRLAFDQLIDIRVTIAVRIRRAVAAIVLEEIGVWVIDAVGGNINSNYVILAGHLRIPVCGVDQFKITIDVDLPKLVYQDHRRVAERRNVAGRYFDRQVVLRPVAKHLHNMAGCRTV